MKRRFTIATIIVLALWLLNIVLVFNLTHFPFSTSRFYLFQHRVQGPFWHWVFYHSGYSLVPLPVLAAVIWSFGTWRRRKPRPIWQCPCGYDLTGNVSGRCPECGRKIE